MTPEIHALLVGEAWTSLEFESKGFDIFTSASSNYSRIGPLRNALEANGIDTEYPLDGEAPTKFPFFVDGISEYDVVVLSDVGYDTLALPPPTIAICERFPDRIRLLEEFVRDGGSFAMIGGYLSFAGFNGKARYYETPIETALPVTLQRYDDRVERSDGVEPNCLDVDHAVLEGMPDQWPSLLGYNRVEPDEAADELVRIDDDPLVVVGEHGNGRSAAFTSDCAPHWAPPAFTEWEHYDRLWTNLVTWLAGYCRELFSLAAPPLL